MLWAHAWLPTVCGTVLFNVALHDWTRSTCSLQGRNVVLESKYGSPRIVNDGVTVAKEVELEDPVENIGAKLVRQVLKPSHLAHLISSKLDHSSMTYL